MSVIRIEDIAHVRFAAPDLGEMKIFLEEFGLRCFEEGGRLYGRGADGAPFAHVTEQGPPRFIGLGLRASSLDDLRKLAEMEGAAIETLDAPGGGSVLRLTDPDGNLVEVVTGQKRGEATPARKETPFNSSTHRRRLRAAVRLPQGPSTVRRLGHAVLNVADFRQSESWYKRRFGFITSDEIEAKPDVAMGAFMRCDRGDTPTDHHTLFLAQFTGKPSFNHAAFEVEGFDDLMVGHAHLRTKGRHQAWGVGRHKLGSQIFDYWKDPWGNELEHWTDGDQFTAADGSNTASIRDLLGVQWGTPFPALAGKRAPSFETVGKIMAFNMAVRRFFNRKSKKQKEAA